MTGDVKGYSLEDHVAVTGASSKGVELDSKIHFRWGVSYLGVADVLWWGVNGPIYSFTPIIKGTLR